MTPWLDDGDVRPVWLNQSHRDALSHSSAQIAQLIVHTWDAAPANAEQAAESVMRSPRWSTRDVLRALGMPDA